MRHSWSSLRTTPLVLLAVSAVLLVACSTSKKVTTTSASTTTAASTVTTGAGSQGGAGDATADSTPADPWARTAKDHQGLNGKKFSLVCPPGGTLHEVWGTETYTDDSSICSAAVHVGLITLVKGGAVVYQIAPGLDAYEPSVGHGVTTQSYDSWPGSFIFPAAAPGTGTFEISPDSWSVSATNYRGQNGKKVTVRCSANGTLGSVYGTVTYTDDSSVCTAAVHRGLITLAKGGTVVILIAPGQPSYKGSTAHGVTSSDYGSWAGSYTFA